MRTKHNSIISHSLLSLIVNFSKVNSRGALDVTISLIGSYGFWESNSRQFDWLTIDFDVMRRRVRRKIYRDETFAYENAYHQTLSLVHLTRQDSLFFFYLLYFTVTSRTLSPILTVPV